MALPAPRICDRPGRSVEGEGALDLLERRWFAAHQQVEALRRDCMILRDVMELASANWRDAAGRLADMEALRDALGEEFRATLPLAL
jgi:hypothetical protein